MRLVSPVRLVKRLRRRVSTGFIAGGAAFAAAMLAPGAASADGVLAHIANRTLVVGSLPQNLSIMGMFMNAGPIVKGVILILLLASLLTWTVWIAKNVELLGASRSLRRAVELLAGARSLNDIAKTGDRVVDALLQEARTELKLSEGLKGGSVNDRIEVRLERVEAASTRRIQSGTNLLASVGSVSPFVGLFGTVWGIMYSFIGISQAHTTNLMVVAPGIAEALLATAFGLVAAVPAVVIYNGFARAIAGYRGLVGDAATLVLCLAGRDLDRRA
ncbi:MAG: tonB-system energizer ExbB [Rhizomicrobium sp.]